MFTPLEAKNILSRKFRRLGKSPVVLKARSNRSFARQQVRRNSDGFTIIEVMIFLTISVAVFATAVLTINSQNRRTAFAQAARDVELQLQDVFNDVENGFYPSSNNFSCSYSGDNPNITGADPKQQGTNEACIFVGKAVQFGRNGDKDVLATSTIVGKRLDDGEEVTRIQDTAPTLLEAFPVANKDVYQINSDVEIEGLFYNHPTLGSFIRFAGMAVISGFAEQEGGTLQSGIVRTSLSPLGLFQDAGSNDSEFLAYINNMTGQSFEAGVVLCLQEKGGGRKAEINIGVESQRLATSSIIDPESGVCAA
jgi:type II secretory pathway pseudopilin PulG